MGENCLKNRQFGVQILASKLGERHLLEHGRLLEFLWQKIIFILILNQNICCGYSKELSQ